MFGVSTSYLIEAFSILLSTGFPKEAKRREALPEAIAAHRRRGAGILSTTKKPLFRTVASLNRSNSMTDSNREEARCSFLALCGA